jgi:hypothetical protein
VIGYEAIVLEIEGLWLAVSHERAGIVQVFPAGGFLGDAFDTFRSTHRRFLSTFI